MNFFIQRMQEFFKAGSMDKKKASDSSGMQQLYEP
jgi:hypothetical protein